MSQPDSALRILLIYRRMIPSIRLCGHCQLEDLAAKGKIEYRPRQGMRVSRADLDWAETVLLGRLDSWYERELVKRLRAAGKRLVYILDDDLLHVPPEVSSASYYNQKQIRECVGDIIGMSDAVLSPSPLLLEKYAVNGRKAIRIEEPALRPAAWAPHAPEEPVKIGFAGSVDRMGDIERILREVLPRIRREYGDRVRFEFFGAVPSFAAELKAECIPYTDSYEGYRETLNGRHWDIGLAPMPESPFHACKHYNKFVEYAAAGIAGIYSDVAPYDRLRAFPGCAVLCGNEPEEWTAAIRRLLEDGGLREDMRKKAAECAAGPLSVERSGEALLQAMEELGRPEAGKVRCRSLELLKIMNIFKRTASSLRGHGIRGFAKRAVSMVFRGKES